MWRRSGRLSPTRSRWARSRSISTLRWFHEFDAYDRVWGDTIFATHEFSAPCQSAAPFWRRNMNGAACRDQRLLDFSRRAAALLPRGREPLSLRRLASTPRSRALPGPRLTHRHAPVAQLDRALDYESRGQEFESLRARQFCTTPEQNWELGSFSQEAGERSRDAWVPLGGRRLAPNPLIERTRAAPAKRTTACFCRRQRDVRLRGRVDGLWRMASLAQRRLELATIEPCNGNLQLNKDVQRAYAGAFSGRATGYGKP